MKKFWSRAGSDFWPTYSSSREKRRNKMAYSRAELITVLTPALVRETASMEKEIRQLLETYETAGLEKELQRQRREGLISQQSPQPQEDSSRERAILDTIRAEAKRQFEDDPERIRQQEEDQRQAEAIYRDYYLTQIFANAVPGHGYPIRNRASEQIILGWLNPGETLGRDFLVRIIQENQSLASKIQWRSVNPKHAEARQQELDKQTFAEAAKNIRTFGVNEANLNVTRSVLGSGFSVYAIQQALESNALQLSPPTQSEREEWVAEDIERHNQELLQANPEQLKARVRQEAEQRRAVQQAEAECQQLVAAKECDSHFGYQELPETWQGRPLDAAFIRTCDVPTQKLLARKFGNAALTARLRGLT
jgi:hypothetical protein